MVGSIESDKELLFLLNQDRCFSVPRSPFWKSTEKNHLKLFPNCASCGEHRLVQVHHIFPFHLYPKLELVESNLISLCMWNRCHYYKGHGFDWQLFNRNIIADAKYCLDMLARIKGNK